MNSNQSSLSDLLLKPLSWPLGLATSIRRFCYNHQIISQKEFAVPIISVGNLTFGGTGKTPFTLWMARHLESRGLKPMILIRGYKGEAENSHALIKCENRFHLGASEVGDEALLLARGLNHSAVVVGKRRSDNLERYFHSINPDVVILDDGHQHLQLDRDLNIVLFDSTMPLNRYQVAPSGYLREKLSALREAKIVILGRSNQVSSTHLAALEQMVAGHISSDTIIAKMDYAPTRILNHQDLETISLEELKDKPVICLAGIASPNSFYQMVESLGADIVDRHTFMDHHNFTEQELHSIIGQAKSHNALVLTTEKDFMRIKQLINHDQINYLEIALTFNQNEQPLLERIEKNISFYHPQEIA